LKKKVLTSSVLAGLGLPALALLVGLGLFLWKQRTEVERLMEILAAGDPGDAAWAFEKLKEVRDLEDFLSYLESTRPTPLEQMSATFHGPLFNGSIQGPPKPFELSKVAQFLLSTRLTGEIELREPGPDLAPRWKRELSLARSVQCRKLSLQEMWFGRHVFPQPKVVPPSKNPALAHLARDCDVEGLLAVLRTSEVPEVMWAVEVLKRAPDDRLDLLVPHLAAAENVPVRSLHWKLENGCSGQTCPDGRSLGAVARFLLWTRLGIRDPALWTEEDSVDPEAPATIRAAWLAHRGPKTGYRAERLSDLDEPYSEQVPEDE
jgi:hypothetical protein